MIIIATLLQDRQPSADLKQMCRFFKAKSQYMIASEEAIMSAMTASWPDVASFGPWACVQHIWRSCAQAQNDGMQIGRGNPRTPIVRAYTMHPTPMAWQAMHEAPPSGPYHPAEPWRDQPVLVRVHPEHPSLVWQTCKKMMVQGKL